MNLNYNKADSRGKAGKEADLVNQDDASDMRLNYSSDHSSKGVKQELQRLSDSQQDRRHEDSDIDADTASYNHQCYICDKIFSANSNLNRHLRKIHKENVQSPYNNVRCALCDSVFSSSSIYNQHLERDHQVRIEIEHKTFDTRDSFDEWKRSVENGTTSQFIKSRGEKKTKSVNKTYYSCNRSGYYVSKARTRKALKKQGSRKINGRCPASMNVTINSDSTYDVKFIRTHVGHDFELKHLDLSEKDRELIVQKLVSGVTKKEIIKQLRSVGDQHPTTATLLSPSNVSTVSGTPILSNNNCDVIPTTSEIIISSSNTNFHPVPSATNIVPMTASVSPTLGGTINQCYTVGQNTTSRLHLATTKDIHNIINSKHLDSKRIRHNYDLNNVEAWISEMREFNEASSVLFYKSQSEIIERFPQIREDDFMLIIMKDGQTESFERYGQKCIIIDSTHNVHCEYLQLSAVSVIDAEGKGLPVAFLFSTRTDCEVLEAFFTILRDKVGLIDTMMVIADELNDFYQAWTRVMSRPALNLLTPWSVFEAWTRKMETITNREKSRRLKKALRTLLTESDADKFAKILPKLLEDFAQDEDCDEFMKFFREKFSVNPDLWSSCSRKNYGSTNLQLLRLHDKFKQVYKEGKNSKKLCKYVASLMTLFDDSQLEQLSQLEDKNPAKQKALLDRHEKSTEAGSMVYEVTVEPVHWLCPSESSYEIYYEHINRMDSNHIVPEEVHIDRLFPKCTPNYNQRQVQTQRRKTRAKKHYRRVRSKSNINFGNLASKNLVNDTSSEELCSNNIPHLGQEQVERPKAQNSESNSHEPTTDMNDNRVPTQSVEIDSSPVESIPSAGGFQQIEKDSTNQDQTVSSEEQPNEKISTSQPNLARRSLTPPGFAQRIQLNSLSEVKDNRSIRSIKVGTEAELSSKPESINEQPSRLFKETVPPTNVRSEGQRVNFNDENLVSFQDDPSPLVNVIKVIDKNPAPHIVSSRREHSVLMPIIREDQNEAEFDDSRPVQSDSQPQENLNDQHDENLQVTQTECNEAPKDNSNLEGSSNSCQPYPHSVPMNDFINNSRHHSQPEIKSSPEIELRVEETDNNQQSNLRHHRLPNESSHFSLQRTDRESAREEVSPRFSNLQFNSLSEVESEGEDAPDTAGPNSNKSTVDLNQLSTIKQTVQSVSVSDPTQQVSQSPINRLTSALLIANGTSSRSLQQTRIDTQIRRAVIFPCLDEGLSSEPESCDEEGEDDDEHAMDADVEGDDDDDDDDVDDDVENTLSSLNRLAVQTALNNGSSHQQQRHQRHSSRSNSSFPAQRSESLFNVTNNQANDQSGRSQLKIPSSGYYSANQEQNFEIKHSPSYPNQNGHWIGAANQTTSLGTRNSSSQSNFNNQRLNLSAHNANLADNKDEVKTLNRLSSDTDNETDRLLGSQRSQDQLKLAANETNNNIEAIDSKPVSSPSKQSANSKEVLIEGVLFNVKYLGSTHNECEGRSEKEDRILQAEMAVKEVKFRNGLTQSAVEVQLFISTEKIMVLDDKHRKIMMDHSLRTISYIADIGDAIVLIVKKKSSQNDATNELGRALPKISCHVFESNESHTITKSISQAFQVAYAELIKANGSGESSSYLPRELDYQEVLNAQEMSTHEIEMFTKSQEVIVPKKANEILGISIVESGWGSVVPTVVIASLKPDGPAYRCKKLSISDHILSVNGISLVGLTLAECQQILHRTKKQRVARLSVVPGSITVEVKIKRPDTKYQLGFSVQNGVICSLLRGGIAERGGVRVGHRIMSINGTTVVGVPHEKIVSLLASSVGEIRMKTCLTSIYRHMTGEEKSVHV